MTVDPGAVNLGVDLLDVSFRLQRALPIQLDQRDWELAFRERRNITAGRLFEVVKSKLGTAVVNDGSEALVRKACAALGQVACIPATEVRLDSAVLELIPRKRLPTDWSELGRVLGWRMPELRGFSPGAMFLPAGCETVGGLIDALVGLNLGHPAVGIGPYSEIAVWAVVRSVLAEALGVEESQIRRDAHLIDDLGME